MATGTAKVRGGELFYDVEGDGRTVVLLHGGMLDHTLWDEQVPLLVGAGYRTVRYDARWHGRSTAEPGDFSLSEDLDDLPLDFNRCTAPGPAYSLISSRNRRSVVPLAPKR